MEKGEARIILGSGKLFMVEYSGTIPEDATIETEGNRFGYIKNGATLEYKGTPVTVSDDLGIVSRTVLTQEEVLLKTASATINGTMLQKLTPTARVTEAAGVRTTKIGGIANQDGKNYLVRFLHEDAEGGDVRVTIVGKNQAGFALTFKPDTSESTSLEFKATPQDSEGTLVSIKEEIPVV